MSFLKEWFRDDPKILDELDGCPTMPETATIQNTFDEINLSVQGDLIEVAFKASGFNMREEEGWYWMEKMLFKFTENQLHLLSDESWPLTEEEHSTKPLS